MCKSLKGAMAAVCKFAAYRAHQQNTLSHSAMNCTAGTSRHVRLTLEAILALDGLAKTTPVTFLKPEAKALRKPITQ